MSSYVQKSLCIDLGTYWLLPLFIKITFSKLEINVRTNLCSVKLLMGFVCLYVFFLKIYYNFSCFFFFNREFVSCDILHSVVYYYVIITITISILCHSLNKNNRVQYKHKRVRSLMYYQTRLLDSNNP